MKDECHGALLFFRFPSDFYLLRPVGKRLFSVLLEDLPMSTYGLQMPQGE